MSNGGTGKIKMGNENCEGCECISFTKEEVKILKEIIKKQKERKR